MYVCVCELVVNLFIYSYRKPLYIQHECFGVHLIRQESNFQFGNTIMMDVQTTSVNSCIDCISSPTIKKKNLNKLVSEISKAMWFCMYVYVLCASNATRKCHASFNKQIVVGFFFFFLVVFVIIQMYCHLHCNTDLVFKWIHVSEIQRTKLCFFFWKASTHRLGPYAFLLLSLLFFFFFVFPWNDVVHQMKGKTEQKCLH